MILIDYSNIAVSNINNSPGIDQGQVDGPLIKHMILNSIRGINHKFRREFGELVICCDAGNYWRGDVFPHYKASRKVQRKKSKFDWGEAFTVIREMRHDLREYFPYKVLCVDKLEADDIIGLLAREATEKTLIISGDKDFVQLQTNPLVKQYSWVKKGWIEPEKLTPEQFLMELIITGDSSDGVPNIKSEADTFIVEGKRQKKIMKKDLAVWVKETDPKYICTSKTMLENFERNKELIDLSYTPEEYISIIREQFSQPAQGNKQKILQYLMENKMALLLQHMNEF